MASASKTGLFSYLGNDILSSIVVFLVALPLCLGVAIATGYPPAAGLISGIIGGIIVGSLSGCPLQVSGPAAGLITILWEAVHQFGIETVGVIIVMAGFIQVVMGLLGLGLWFRAVSPAVIQGMLAGIGLLIFSSQFHIMVDDVPKGDGLTNLLTIPSAIQKGVFISENSVHHIAALIGVVTITVIVLWNMAPKRWKLIPAPLVAIVVATIVASVMHLPIKHVSVPDNLFSSLKILDLSSIGQHLTDSTLWIAAGTIAFIASAATLLTATAVDQMSPSSPRTHYNKEIIAQGIGNLMAGFIGVLPVTGVIVRSSANVQAGGKTRLATIIHGLWILAFVLVLPFTLELIPVASLAAILVYTGYKLMNVKEIRKLAKFGRSEVAIYFATVAGIITTNLLEGILIGLGLALIKHIYVHSHLSIEQQVNLDNHETHVSLKGSASFVTLPKLASTLEAIPNGQQVVIHASHLSFIDHACTEFLQNWEEQYETQDGQVDMQWSK